MSLHHPAAPRLHRAFARLALTALLGSLLSLAGPGTAAAQAGPAPDLILVNGKVFTSDSARPWAQAVAISGSRIQAVGGSDELRALAGPGTRVLDLGGRTVIPGLNDSHVHALVPQG